MPKANPNISPLSAPDCICQSRTPPRPKRAHVYAPWRVECEDCGRRGAGARTDKLALDLWIADVGLWTIGAEQGNKASAQAEINRTLLPEDRTPPVVIPAPAEGDARAASSYLQRVVLAALADHSIPDARHCHFAPIVAQTGLPTEIVRAYLRELRTLGLATWSKALWNEDDDRPGGAGYAITSKGLDFLVTASLRSAVTRKKGDKE